MITEYKTRSGHTLWLGRLDRREIDASAASNPPPVPPMKTAVTWAGHEEIPDRNDPGYLAELGRYYRNLGKSQVAMIAPAVTLPANVDFGELYELIESGFVKIPVGSLGDERVSFMLYVLDDIDRGDLVQIVLYNSTVTDRGIFEAAARLNVQWMKKPITVWGIPSTPGGYGPEFEARRAARHSLIPWPDFCQLTGPEQSAVVCFCNHGERLEYYQTVWRNRKTK